MNDTVALGTYLHSKSRRLYQVIGIALQTETNEELVIYRPLYDSEHPLFARPVGMFTGSVKINGETLPRFEFVHA